MFSSSVEWQTFGKLLWISLGHRNQVNSPIIFQNSLFYYYIWFNPSPPKVEKNASAYISSIHYFCMPKLHFYVHFFGGFYLLVCFLDFIYLFILVSKNEFWIGPKIYLNSLYRWGNSAFTSVPLQKVNLQPGHLIFSSLLIYSWAISTYSSYNITHLFNLFLFLLPQCFFKHSLEQTVHQWKIRWWQYVSIIFDIFTMKWCFLFEL